MLATALFAAIVLSPCLGVEFRLNGASLVVLGASELASRSGPLVLEGGEHVRGLALGELLPLLSEAWRMELRSARETRVVSRVEAPASKGPAAGAAGSSLVEDSDLANRLFSIYVVEGKTGGWDLCYGIERFRDLSSVALTGEILDEDGLEVWLSWEGVGELKAEIARFAKEHGKRITCVEVPNTQTKLLTLARAGGKLPDLAQIQSDYVPALAGARIIQGIGRLRTDRLASKGFEAFESGGVSWAVPLYYDAQLVFYNKKLVGVPPVDWSLDDLAALAREADSRAARSSSGKLKAPFCFNAYSAYWLVPFIAGFGKERFVEPDGRILLDDGSAKKALDAIIALRDDGVLVPAERDAMVSWFASGKAAFILAGSYSIPEFSKLGIDFGTAPYPLAARGGRPIAPLLDFKGFAISRRTERPVLARRLIEHLTGQSFQRRFTAALGKLPANLAASESSREANPYWPSLSRSARIGIVVPPAESYALFKNVMWKLLRLVLSGEMGTAEAIDTAQRLVDAGLAERK